MNDFKIMILENKYLIILITFLIYREKTYSYSSDWFEYPIESKSFYNELGKSYFL